VLRIRLARFGAKKRPIYRVVVIERERARNGRFVEVVGQYNPLTDPATVVLNADRVRYWMDKGAQPSERVRYLLEKQPVEKQPGPEEQVAELGA
jgi:small subunit ribosomal protein S16